MMTIDCDGLMDLLLKSAAKPVSVLLGPGRNEIDLPLATETSVQPGYELNPASAGASCNVLSIRVEPLTIEPAQCWSSSPERSFASVDASSAGYVLFSLPYHQFWEAQVDGAFAVAESGPGNTVMVAVAQGRHLVSIRYVGSQ